MLYIIIYYYYYYYLCYYYNIITAASFLFCFSVPFLEQKGNNHYGYCQAGISAEYTVDGEDVIMGTVGVRRWKGIIIINEEFEENDNTSQFFKLKSVVVFLQFFTCSVSARKFYLRAKVTPEDLF